MVKRLKIIVNPISGSGRAMRFLERLKDALAKEQIECQVAPTQKAGDAINLAQTHPDATPILCLGGDGTFNEVINGLLANTRFGSDSRPVLGFIPFGSGNVIAKELHLKRNIRQFIHLFQNNLSRQLDLGCVTLPKENLKRYFISMAGIGFDAEVAQKYHLARQDGSRLQASRCSRAGRSVSACIGAHLFSYFPIAITTLFSYQAPKINVHAEDKLITDNASFVQIANVRSYGGPFVLVNKAIHNDGLLDACWFIGKSSLSILLYYTLAFLGNLPEWPFGRAGGSLAAAGHQRVKKVVISSSSQFVPLAPPAQCSRSRSAKPSLVPLQVDGDFCGYLPAEIEIIPKAVRIFTPIT